MTITWYILNHHKLPIKLIKQDCSSTRSQVYRNIYRTVPRYVFTWLAENLVVFPADLYCLKSVETQLAPTKLWSQKY